MLSWYRYLATSVAFQPRPKLCEYVTQGFRDRSSSILEGRQNPQVAFSDEMDAWLLQNSVCDSDTDLRLIGPRFDSARGTPRTAIKDVTVRGLGLAESRLVPAKLPVLRIASRSSGILHNIRF